MNMEEQETRKLTQICMDAGHLGLDIKEENYMGCYSFGKIKRERNEISFKDKISYEGRGKNFSGFLVDYGNLPPAKEGKDLKETSNFLSFVDGFLEENDLYLIVTLFKERTRFKSPLLRGECYKKD